MIRRFAPGRFAALLCVLALPIPAGAQTAAPSQSQLAALLARVGADPTTPEQYNADVQLHVRLRIFPFISLTLHGNEAYKHPGLYHFVFRGVPRAAEHFSDMAYDLGNAAAWPDRYEIALLTPPSPGVDPVLELTPKKRGMVKTLDVTVDQQKGHIIKAVWTRFDGGVISLVQHYDSVGTKEVVAEQDAQIRIPHMKADLTATYDNFSLATGNSPK